jgi:hypothetical protein
VRARTRAGRLHAFDRWLSLDERPLLATPGQLVDVGFGSSAVTTHELASAVPGHPVVGLELDAARVDAGRREFPGLDLRAGGLDTMAPTPSLVVRVANVARGLTKDDADRLHAQLVPWLVEGGVGLEGSTDVEGHVSSFWVLRRRGGEVVREALVFHTDFARGFSPWLFRDVLPRALRRDVKAGTPIAAFFEAWADAWEAVRTEDPAASFRASVELLSQRRADVLSRHVQHGFCAWHSPA